MATAMGESGDTVQNGKLDREKENVPKNSKQGAVGNGQGKLVNGVTSKKSSDEKDDIALTANNVSHLVIL